MPKNKTSQVNLSIKNKKLKTEISVTNYKLLNTKNGISQLLYSPKTGKTHQLRIVSKNLGCPIIGDKKYNALSNLRKEKLMLHAFSLKFTINNKLVEYFADLPDHFITFIKKNNLTLTKNYQTHLDSF